MHACVVMHIHEVSREEQSQRATSSGEFRGFFDLLRCLLRLWLRLLAHTQAVFLRVEFSDFYLGEGG